MMKSSAISVRVGLVEDHLLVSAGLVELLKMSCGIQVVGTASTGKAGIELARSQKPDVLVLDLHLPDMHGFEVLEKVRDLCNVCVLTFHSEFSYVTQALKAGALSYVCKDVSSSELIDAVKATARGEPYYCAVSKRAIFSLNGPVASPNQPKITGREAETLELAAQGLTSAEIGGKLGISRRTAEVHRARIMKKLGLKTHTDLVLYAIRAGMVQVESQESSIAQP